MTDAPTNRSEEESDTKSPKRTRLKDALYVVRDRQADRDDVVVELRESERSRLEHLAEGLQSLFSDVDENDDRFEFAISQGERPRLWIDVTSHICMAHDRRTYRFLKDTRMGRTVLADTSDVDAMAENVSLYVAEKVLERERALEGEWLALKRESRVDDLDDDNMAVLANEEQKETVNNERPSRAWRMLQGVFSFLFGTAIVAALIGIALYFYAPEVLESLRPEFLKLGR